MLDKLIIGLLIVASLLTIIVTIIVRKGRIPIKFAIIWYIPSAIIFILALVPQVFIYFASILGFQTISSLTIGIFFVLLFFIVMALTVLIAGQTTKINLLIQEISILKKRVAELENKNNE